MTRRTSVRASVLASVAVLLASMVGLRPADAVTLPAQEVPGIRVIYDLFCRSDGTCLAVGHTSENVGAVVLLRAGGPSGPVRPVPGTVNLSAIACPPGGTCIAVGRSSGGGGFVVEVGPDGTPWRARPAPGTEELLEVACPTATTCIAVGLMVDNPEEAMHFQTRSPRFTVITNGRPAPSQPFAPGVDGYVNGIACPTASTCLAPNGDAVSILTATGAGWTATANDFAGSFATGHPAGPISCASTTSCTAAAHGWIPTSQGYRGVPAIMTVSADGTLGPVQILDQQSGILTDISCVTSRTCTVVRQDNSQTQSLLIDISRGSPAPPIRVENADSLSAVSCVGVARCGIVGHSTTGGSLFLWHGALPG